MIPYVPLFLHKFFVTLIFAGEVFDICVYAPYHQLADPTGHLLCRFGMHLAVGG